MKKFIALIIIAVFVTFFYKGYVIGSTAVEGTIQEQAFKKEDMR